jgi:chromosome segregation ATPase
MKEIEMEITLARLLKYRKRVQQEIARLAQDIQGHNSVLKGAEREVDVRADWKKYRVLVQHLADLKDALFKANAPIYGRILRLANCKSEILMLRAVKVDHGARPHFIGEHIEEWEAELRKAEIDQTCKELESEIDALQDELDNFNHMTTVEVEYGLV